MKYSHLFIPTLKDTPADADTASHKLLLRSGMVRKVASGIYEWLPLGFRVLKKVEQIIREEINAVGGQELLLPTLHPKDLWEETGRWSVYGKELMRLKDRQDREFALGPTHEEVITDLVRKDVRSYKQLPLMLYQFQTKFRDEIRPRFGVVRAREFLMKDAYSFHATDEDLDATYQRVVVAYGKILNRCGVNFRQVEAQSGAIGGSYSHEFMVTADTGEDALVWCDCGYGANVEKAQAKEGDPCPRCQKPLKLSRGIEVCHAFKLGTKYSEAMKAVFLDAQGVSHPLIMGCYGVGVSRIVAAVIEQRHDANGILWPLSLAPYQVVITAINYDDPGVVKAADGLYEDLKKAGWDVLLDDRDERGGVKFKDADLIGIPIRLTVSLKTLPESKAELKFRDKPDIVFLPLNKVVSSLEERRTEKP